jgi:hypothetical protein
VGDCRRRPGLGRSNPARLPGLEGNNVPRLPGKLRDTIIPTLRQQGMDGAEAKTGTPYWSWARLLGRVFDLDMATCPFCHQGTRRIIAAITQETVITRILRHLKLAAVPPPIAPARVRQAIFAFD